MVKLIKFFNDKEALFPDFFLEAEPITPKVGDFEIWQISNSSEEKTFATVVPADFALAGKNLSDLAKSGCDIVLFGETSPLASGLLEKPVLSVFSGLAALAREYDLKFGFVGRLEAADINRFRLLSPDFLGFSVPPREITDIRLLLQQEQKKPVIAKRPVPDKIFIKDLTVNMILGVYEIEQHTPQRVRFSVEAETLPTDNLTKKQTIADVFSYDLISDTIRLLAASRHFTLIEALGEEIAQALLAYPQILSIRLRIEKPDTPSGLVGTEIVRISPEYNRILQENQLLRGFIP